MEAPEWLDDVAKQVYRETANAFADLAEKDPALLEAYAQVSSLCQQMSAILKEQGLTHLNARGYPAANCVLNPYKGYLKQRADLYDKISKKFKPANPESDGFA
jgi:phage terminase small subunit